MRVKKRPIEVEAKLFDPGIDYNEALDVAKWCGGEPIDEGLRLETLESKDHIVSPGDYVIKGIRGEFYSCKPDVFHKTYDIISDNKGLGFPEARNK